MEVGHRVVDERHAPIDVAAVGRPCLRIGCLQGPGLRPRRSATCDVVWEALLAAEGRVMIWVKGRRRLEKGCPGLRLPS